MHINSITAFLAVPFLSVYAAANSFTDNFARYLSYDESSYVVSVRPSFMKTDMI